jgi:hypothetical protein
MDINNVNDAYREWQGLVAVIFGIAIQFALGEHKNYKVMATIITSSLFVALFIVPAVVELMGVDPAGKVAIAMYALSAVLSVELIAMLVQVLPSALRAKVLKSMGVDKNDL